LPAEVIGQVLFNPIPRPSHVATPSGIRSPSSVARRIPADLEAIVMRLLERDRARRFPNADAVVEALLACKDAPRNGRGELQRLLAERFSASPVRLRSSTPPGSVPSQPAMPATVSIKPTTLEGAASQRMSVARSKSRRALYALLALAILAIGAGTAFIILYRPKPADEPRAAMSPTDGGTQLALGHANPADASTATVAIAIDAAPAAASVDAGAAAASDTGARLDAGTGSATAATNAPADAAVATNHAGSGGSLRRPADRKPSSASPPKGTGELIVQVSGHAPGPTWGEVWIDSRQVCAQTPCRAQLPAGKHRVRLVNPDMDKTDVFPVTITPDQTTTVRREW
jgi:hypothetical protein